MIEELGGVELLLHPAFNLYLASSDCIYLDQRKNSCSEKRKVLLMSERVGLMLDWFIYID